MPFQPKNKLGGRTEEGERVRKLCRAKTEEAVRALVEALEAVDADGLKDHDKRIKAAVALLDRGYGKPAQAITGDDGGPIKVDNSAGLLEALKRLAGEK